MRRNCTILLEGAHRVGKGVSVGLLCKHTSYAHSLLDRGFASAYAFGKVFGRELINLDLAIHDYFANPSAVLVYFALGQEDYEADRAKDEARKSAWVGISTEYSNRDLDSLIRFATLRAMQLGYSDRVLWLTAREHQPVKQAQAIVQFVNDLAANLEAKC